jgi:hypothetical protein
LGQDLGIYQKLPIFNFNAWQYPVLVYNSWHI